MPQSTNLNTPPYFEDFNSDDNFHKVLFRPGFPLQARELTTLQSILQDQIEKFGSSIYKDGAMVIPGQVGYDLKYNALLIEDEYFSDNEYDDENQSINSENITDDIEDELVNIKNYTKIIRSLVKYNNNEYLSATIDKCENFTYYNE